MAESKTIKVSWSREKGAANVIPHQTNALNMPLVVHTTSGTKGPSGPLKRDRLGANSQNGIDLSPNSVNIAIREEGTPCMDRESTKFIEYLINDLKTAIRPSATLRSD